MEASASQSSGDESYPPLPESGPPEDSDLAQKNFADRERFSRSWRIRLFSKRKSIPTLLEKRSRVLTFDSESSTTTTTSLNIPRDSADVVTTAHVSEPGPSQQPTSDTRAARSSDTGQIIISELDEQNHTLDQHLYLWAMVYENQRG